MFNTGFGKAVRGLLEIIMNFVFIAPDFPDNYRHFCDRLNKNGVTVLGIGECPYDALSDTLKSSLAEYYKVDSLEAYDQVYRAVAYFAFRHGRIDWIESNNEYWLSMDARLRQDFNVKQAYSLMSCHSGEASLP